MDLESRISDLKAEIELMATTYYKGFGNAIWRIGSICDEFAVNQESNTTKEIAIKALERIERHYQTIPFDKLISNPDYSYLFVCRELLDSFGKQTKQYLSNQQPELLEKIHHTGIAIHEVGTLYKARFKEKIEELRQYKGYEEFEVTVIDHKGRQFNI